MTVLELLLVGVCVLLALIVIGLRFALRELREIKQHLADEKVYRLEKRHAS